VEKQERLRKIQHIERLLLLPLLAGVAAAFFCLGRVEVLGNSMEPTYKDGQRMLVLKTWTLTGLKVGDVVVVKPASKKGREAQVIKRIVFIQNSDGTLRWPGMLPTSRGGQLTPLVFGPHFTSKLVPPRGILVLGDNFENSTDSREFGPVYPEDILAKVLQ
jgi:signal peptidase I